MEGSELDYTKYLRTFSMENTRWFSVKHMLLNQGKLRSTCVEDIEGYFKYTKSLHERSSSGMLFVVVSSSVIIFIVYYKISIHLVY